MSTKTTESLEDRWKNAKTALKGKATESILMSATKNTTKMARPEYIGYLQEYTFSKAYKLDVMVTNLIKRLKDAHSLVVLKALILSHTLMRDGNPEFSRILSTQMQSIHSLGSFSDRKEGSLVSAVRFIRVYGAFIEGRLHSLRKVGKDFVNCGPFDEDALFQSLPIKDALALLYYLKHQLSAFLKVKTDLKQFLDSEMIAAGLLLIIKDAITLYRVFVSGLIVFLSKFTLLDPDEANEVVMYFSWSLNITKVFNYILHSCKHLTREGLPKLLEIPPMALDIIKGNIVDESHLHLLDQPQTINEKEDEEFRFNTVQNIDREIDLVYFGKDPASSEIWLTPTVDLNSPLSPGLDKTIPPRDKKLTIFNPFVSDTEDEEDNTDVGYLNKNNNKSANIPAVNYNFDPLDSSNYAKAQETSLVVFNDPLLDFYSNPNSNALEKCEPADIFDQPLPVTNKPVYAEFDPLLSSIFGDFSNHQIPSDTTSTPLKSPYEEPQNKVFIAKETQIEVSKITSPTNNTPNYDILRQNLYDSSMTFQNNKEEMLDSPNNNRQISKINDQCNGPNEDDYNPFM